VKQIVCSAVAAVVFSGVSNAQVTSVAVTPAFKASGAFFALSVADIDASERWYAEKLGMRVTMRAPKLEKTAVVVLEGGGLTVELLQHSDAVALKAAASAVAANYLIHGPFKVGVIIEDFDGLVATLRTREIPIAIGPFRATRDQPANLIIRDN
jgi:catechol 2,3-dioxygenase-like lactoylglutathione lyase family enzyme